MQEFIKKFYWLIFTSVFSLFIFFITEFFSQFGNISFSEEDWKVPTIDKLDTVTIYINNRSKVRNLYDSRINSLNDRENFNFGECQNLSLKYDLEIRKSILILNKIIKEWKNLKEYHSFVEALNNLNNYLKNELKIWGLYERYSTLYLDDSSNFNWGQFQIEINKQTNILKSIQYEGQLIDQDMPSMLQSMINDETFMALLKILGLGICLVILGYIIIKYLVPIGLVIWNEKSERDK